MKIKNISIIALTVLILSACSSYKSYDTPDVEVDDLYRTESTDTTNMAELPWQELFTDPHLRSLIDSALTNNFDYRSVALKVTEAQATFAQSRAAFFPTLNLSAQEDIFKAEGMKHTETYNFAATASWQLSAGLFPAKRGAKEAMLQSIAAKRGVETQLVAGVATGYFTLLALDRQLEISLENEILFKQTVKTMEGMFHLGVNRAAIEQSRASLYSLQASIEDLRSNIRKSENALCLLTGRAPGNIERGRFEDQKIDVVIATGIPSQLLANRPDVMQAEAGVRFAIARTNLARTRFYPSFTLTGTGGYTNGAMVGYTPRFFADFVAGLVQPIFNMGTNRANLRISKAQQQAAVLAFEKSLVNAGVEVSNALYSYSTTDKKLDAREKQVKSMKQASDDTNFAFTRQGATYLEVLTAQQGLLSAQLSLVTDQLSQLSNVVSLYQALGGGWERPAELEK